MTYMLLINHDLKECLISDVNLKSLRMVNCQKVLQDIYESFHLASTLTE